MRFSKLNDLFKYFTKLWIHICGKLFQYGIAELFYELYNLHLAVAVAIYITGTKSKLETL